MCCYIHTYPSRIDSQTFKKIDFENRRKQDKGNDCMMSVDGTDCPIEKKGRRWYSHKFKKPGVRYEVGVAIKSGDIVWINGPYPCGAYADIKIFGWP